MCATVYLIVDAVTKAYPTVELHKIIKNTVLYRKTMKLGTKDSDPGRKYES
jgi:hypothetical protein